MVGGFGRQHRTSQSIFCESLRRMGLIAIMERDVTTRQLYPCERDLQEESSPRSRIGMLRTFRQNPAISTAAVCRIPWTHVPALKRPWTVVHRNLCGARPARLVDLSFLKGTN